MRDVAPLRCWRGKTDEATCFLGKHGSLLLSFCAKMLDCFHNIHWSLIGSAKRFAEVRESPVALSSLIFHGKHGKIAQLQLRQRLAHTDGSSRLLVNGFFSWHVPRSPAGGRCDVSRGLETTTKDCVLQNGTLSVSPPSLLLALPPTVFFYETFLFLCHFMSHPPVITSVGIQLRPFPVFSSKIVQLNSVYLSLLKSFILSSQSG